MASRIPWLPRQAKKPAGPVAGAPEPPCEAWLVPVFTLPVFAIDAQAAGVALTGCPAALTGPLDRSQAPGRPGRLTAKSVKVLPPGPVWAGEKSPCEVTGMATWSGGARLGRTHSGMATWRAAKTARVTAMAGTVRRISAPAVTPRAKANAA